MTSQSIRDGPLAEPLQIHHRAKTASDEALNLLGASALASARGFARRALARGARQHPILAGDPTRTLPTQERRHSVFHARGAQHLGGAEFHQHRALRMKRVAASELHRPKLVGRSTAGTHAETCGWQWSLRAIIRRNPLPFRAVE